MKSIVLLFTAAVSLTSVIDVHAQFVVVGTGLTNSGDQVFNLNGGTGEIFVKNRSPEACANICHNAPPYVDAETGATVVCVGFNRNSRGRCVFRRDISNPIPNSDFTLYRLTGLVTNAPVPPPTPSPTTNSPTRKGLSPPPTKKPTRQPTIATTRTPTLKGKTERRCGNKGKMNGVCGFTPVEAWDETTGQGDCLGKKVTYKRAKKICAEEGISTRLCTAKEIVKKVAMNTGCRLNREYIWTKSQSNCGRNKVKVMAGDGKKWAFTWSGEYDQNGDKVFVRTNKMGRRCVNKRSNKKAHVRCCADDELFTANDGVDYYDGLSGDF